MKITALAALLMGAGASAANFADSGLNFGARNMATKMLAGIGVGIEWHDARSCPGDALRIGYSTSSPAKLMPGALAYAMPYEGTHIVVFYARVQAAVESKRVPALLAHVLAHEITHIPEGTPRHSAEGVRKAHWTADDYSRMCWKPLKFADEDVVPIHRGLERRAALRNAGQTRLTAACTGE